MLILYDVGMSPMEARKSIKYQFMKNFFVTDQRYFDFKIQHTSHSRHRVIDRLVVKAYMELEETIMQWKQQNHLVKILQPPELQIAVEAKVLDAEVDEMMDQIKARVHRRE